MRLVLCWMRRRLRRLLRRSVCGKTTEGAGFGPRSFLWSGGRSRIGAATGVPGGLPVGVDEPSDGADHGSDGVDHVGEIDGLELVGGLVVVGVKAEAGDGLSDDAEAGEIDVVGALKEFLCGVGILDEVGSVAG